MPVSLSDLLSSTRILLKNMYTTMFRHVGYTEKAILLLVVNRHSRTIKEILDGQLSIAAELSTMASYRQSKRPIPFSLISRVVDTLCCYFTRGFLEDLVSYFIKLTKDYPRLYRRWERTSSLVYDTTLWERTRPDRVLEAKDDVLELSRSLHEVETKLLADRSTLYSVVNNVRQLYGIYKVKRQLIIRQLQTRAVNNIRRRYPHIVGSERFCLSSLAAMEAYRSYRDLGTPANLLTLTNVKLKEVIRTEFNSSLLIKVSRRAARDDANNDFVKNICEVNSNKVEWVAQEQESDIDEVLSWQEKQELLSRFLRERPVTEFQQKIAAICYGVWEQLFERAEKGKRKGDVAEMLRQYVARFLYQN